jgi:hypothetical protein
MSFKKSRRIMLTAALLAQAMAAGGCTGDSNEPTDTLPRVAVSGTITFDGKPLPEGKIQFQPVGSDGPAVIAVGAVQDGTFSIDRPSGPTPGKYRVMISSQAPVKFSGGAEPTPKPEPEKIPEKYNRKSKEEVEVKPDTPQTFNFSLVKK